MSLLRTKSLFLTYICDSIADIFDIAELEIANLPLIRDEFRLNDHLLFLWIIII